MLVHDPDAISAAGKRVFLQCHHRACPGDPRLTFCAGEKDVDGQDIGERKRRRSSNGHARP